jgi:hypothetical protein
MRRYTEPGPNPTRTLVANSQNPHSSTEVSRIKSWVPSGGRQFATSVLVGFRPNGIQLGSKCLLPQGLTQCTTCFCHEGEGFGPPLCDPGLDPIGPYGMDA